MTLYDWASRYVAIGWSVIPVNNNKMPAIPEVIPFRTTYATDTQLREWFGSGLNGIAVITGKLSGIMVIDDDTAKKAGLPDDLISHMNSSVMSKTATGGRHFFLKYEEGYKNSVNIGGKHIDIRTEGGYVIVPPTTRVFNDGRRKYEWISPPTKENLEAMPMFSASPEVIDVVKNKNIKTIDPNEYLFLSEGGRNDGLLRLTRSFLNKNPKEWVYDLIKNINKNYNPPLTDKEIDNLFKQAVKYYEEDKRLKIKQPKQLGFLIDERIKERSYEAIAPSTGYSKLDKLILGFIPGNLYCLTGDTNSGKTIMACNFACAVADQNKKVLYIALETGNRIIEALASVRKNKPYIEITVEDLQDRESNIEFFVDNDIENVEDLGKILRELDRHYNLVIIDHIGYFVSDRLNYLQEQANILKRLRSLTKEKHIAILLVAHLRKRPKETSRKKDFIPTADDIAGSAAFKQDSTDVLIVIRSPDPNDPHKLKHTAKGWLYVVKTKNGSPGAVDLLFHDTDIYGNSAKIEEIDENNVLI